MTDKELKQLVDDLKKKLGNVSTENLNDYIKEAEDYIGKGKFDEATAIYNAIVDGFPQSIPLHKKRLDALANSLRKAEKGGA